MGGLSHFLKFVNMRKKGIMAEEKNFENKIKQYLKSIGIYSAGTPYQSMEVPCRGFFAKIWGGGFQKGGIPDIILCINGVFVGLELKASHSHPSPIQIKNLELIGKSGGYGLLVYPKGFENLKKIIFFILGETAELPDSESFCKIFHE